MKENNFHMNKGLYIGRFQPPHGGHFSCIRWILEKHGSCLILVRDTKIDKKNPYSLKIRIKRIEEEFAGKPVMVISIPDFETAYIGRDVGYGLIQLEEELERISATDIRKKLYERGKGFVIWFTGLSSAGKTTVAKALTKRLKKMGHRIEHLDGDTFRKQISADLTFSDKDRMENIRRAGYVAKTLSRQGIGVVASFISPHRKIREELKKQIPNFIEVYMDTPIHICKKRDKKGLYKSKTPNLTGVDGIYEPPLAPSVHIKHPTTIKNAVEKILNVL